MQQYLEKNRWLMLVAALVLQCLAFFPSSWGVFQPYVAQHYGYTPDAATLVMPLCVAAFGVFSIIGGRVQDVVSPRAACLIGAVMISLSFFNAWWIPAGNPLYMYLGFSLFFGGGCGFYMTTVFALLMKWFVEKKGFAGGITGGGAGLYAMAFTYVAEWALAGLGVRGTFFAMFILNVVVTFGLLPVFVNPSQRFIDEKAAIAQAAAADESSRKKTAPEGPDFTTKQMLRTRQYYQLIFSIICIMPIFILTNPALVSIAMEKGLSKSLAVNALALSALAAALGRFVIPWVSDYLGRRLTLSLSFGAVALMAFFFMNAQGIWVIVTFFALAVFYNGGFAIIAPITSEMFGFKYNGTNMGFVNIANSIGAVVAPTLLAFATPILGGNARYLIGITTAAIAFILMFTLDIDTRQEKARLEQKGV